MGVGGAPRSSFVYVNSRLKRNLDLVIVFVMSPIVAPLVVFLALLIYATTREKPFFIQWRYGCRKVPFRILKLRTMRSAESGGGFRQAIPNDSRCTIIGSVLRRTSLDELPQLWNVLIGNMSLVGPRPHPVELDNEFAPLIEGYERRFDARPGITGLAQVSGARGETPTVAHMASRIDWDVRYVEASSFRADVRILVATIGAIVTARQAH